VRALRKRKAIEDYESTAWDGAYWGIRTDIRNYELPDAIPCDHTRTLELANVSTRLGKLKPERQERIMNWGYAVADAGVRKHFDTRQPAPDGLPYPESGI
jgi:NTE family protein